MEKERIAVDNTGVCAVAVVRKGDAVVERASRDSILSIVGVVIGLRVQVLVVNRLKLGCGW